MFDAIVFAVIVLGFEPRCALERDTGTQDRLQKIFDLIRSCRFGIHDLSFMAIDMNIELPRYNMVFELGIFLGCTEYGGNAQSAKSCLILDRDRYRYRKSLSDLSGRDIQSHDGSPATAIDAVRNFLATESNDKLLPGGTIVAAEFAEFVAELPVLCSRLKWTVANLQFNDYCAAVKLWQKTRT